KNILILSLSLLLTALCAWYYLVGSVIFLGLLVLFNYQKFLLAKKQYFILAGGMALAVLIPALPIFLNRSPTAFKYIADVIDQLGTDPLNFFIPHSYIISSSWSVYRFFRSP